MRGNVWVAGMLAIVLMISACQSGGSTATDSTKAKTGTNDTTDSITATVTFPWALILNSSEDPLPKAQPLNEETYDICSMTEQVDTCNSPGPFKDGTVTIICFDDTEVGGIMGVLPSKEQLVNPDQVLYRSNGGNSPVGFMSIEAIGGWDYPLFNKLAEKLGVTVEDGLQCNKHTHRV